MRNQKSVCKFLLVMAIVLIAGVSSNISQKKITSVSELSLSNIEALASSESSNPCRYCKFTTLQICWEDDVQGCLGERVIWEI